MPRSKHSGRSGKRRVIPSKNALLPLPQTRITEISLGYHLALAACGGVHGSSHLFNELTRAIYLTFYLGEMGYMPVALDLYRMAEAGLEAGIRRGNEKRHVATGSIGGGDTGSSSPGSRFAACERACWRSDQGRAAADSFHHERQDSFSVRLGRRQARQAMAAVNAITGHTGFYVKRTHPTRHALPPRRRPLCQLVGLY